MKAAMYYSNSDVRIEEMPRPVIGKGELLVKVMASGICGSDVMEWYRARTAPRVLGHEIAGEIAEAWAGVRGFEKGDRVFVSHHVPCNACRHCLRGHHTACDTLRKTNIYPGGFAEYVRVPRINVERGTFLLPHGMTFEQGTFIEPLACVVRAQGMAGVSPGDTVLVTGSGMAGLLNIRLALARGARVFATDISEYRLGMARESGACTIKAADGVPKRMAALNGGCLADRVIVCTGALSAAGQAFRSVERGGVITFFAVPKPGEDVTVPLNDFWKDEIKLMTSYGAAPGDIEESIRLIQSGGIAVDDMVTHRLPLKEAGRGFRLVAGAGESMKVIIRPHGS